MCIQIFFAKQQTQLTRLIIYSIT